jgi:hypothetical protein
MKKALLIFSLLISSFTLAQQPDSTAAPRLPSGTPDFNGLWSGGGPIGDIAGGLMPGEAMVLTEEYAVIKAGRLANEDPEANCLPTGVPRIAPYPWRIVQTPAYGPATHLYFLFEGNVHSFRQIFMDGREHPPADDLDPSWYGHSIGWWEGDTLVIDSIGFNDLTWFDFLGNPHSTELHTIERYTRTDNDTLENITTVIDPLAYRQAFTIRYEARLQPADWDLMEYVCNENNQDVEHIEGPARLF